MPTTRRDFLKLLGLGAATAAASASGISIAEAEPVRRYWQVGANLRRGGLQPIEGQPGLFRDSNGQIIRIGEWRDSCAYDTVVIPSPQMETIGNAYGGDVEDLATWRWHTECVPLKTRREIEAYLHGLIRGARSQ